ncbi:LPAR6 protein, partial [Notiomystis cincta]|nr:LPAR6 protein [Notiomystis cincta]
AMAGVSWAEGGSSGTDSPLFQGTNSSSAAAVGADLQHSLFAVSYSAVSVLGLAGNALSLSLLSCRAKPLSHSYIFLLQLALLDTLLLCVLPLHIHSQLHGDSWAFGDTACGLSGALFCLHVSLSVAFLGCLCVDLWLAVLHPFTSIRLRATHYVLLATALWGVALGVTVPLVLHSRGERSSTACSGSFSWSWAHPTAPQTILPFIFGFLVPVSTILLGFPLLAGSIWQSRRRAARRKALGTISIVLAICALCFLPYHLCQLLHLLLRLRAIPEHIAGPHLQRVSSALSSFSCCLNPVLYRFHCSSRRWRCPFRLRSSSKRVFTVCDHNFGDPSWHSEAWKEKPRGWKQ